MTALSSDLKAWDRALQKGNLLYPNENVVRFLAHIKNLVPNGANALEIGFGSGNHLRLLMDYGFVTHGTELLESAIKRGKLILSKNPFAGSLIMGNLDTPLLNIHDFHVILGWGSILSFFPNSKISKYIQRIYDLMASNSYACFNLRTKDNWFYGLGREIEPEHWVLDHRTGDYEGTQYTFRNQQEVEEVFKVKNFEIINLEKLELFSKNLSKKHSWWIIWIHKP